MRPKCQYGCKCYQKNPQHWTEFDHPAEHERLAGSKRKQPEVIDLDDEPADGPEVIELMRMGFAAGAAREAFASERTVEKAVGFLFDRRDAENLAERLASSEQGDAALAAALATEFASELAPNADAALARRLQQEEQAHSLQTFPAKAHSLQKQERGE